MSWFGSSATETGITHRDRLWLYLLSGLLLAFLVLPTLLVIPMSFSASRFLEFPPQHISLHWYEHYLGSITWQQATETSLEVSVLTSLVATTVGTAAAYGLSASRMRLAQLAGVILLLPIIVPVILTAIGIFYIFVKIKLLDSIGGLVLADSTLAVPIVFMVITAALRGHDPRQEMAARNLGATRFGAFIRVTLPQIRFAVVTAAVLSFLTAFDEVVIALFISGGDHPTLTRIMFNALRNQIDPTIAAVSTLMMFVSTVLMACAFIGGRERK
ncbi:ABC transporter permease [Solirhodobacter olei]|uniref:ABC transporter permease n=1 Tax=Solirhodobacter olei TaxID=2493082 RepID=UPI000FDA17AB|nr:ABC transporter permease [Solirhodobacter olei]